MSHNHDMPNILTLMPSWLWSPKDASKETLLRASLKSIDRTAAAIPSGDDAWSLYQTMTSGMTINERWLDKSARVWLFVSALQGVDAAADEICGYISGITEDGIISYLNRQPSKFKELAVRVNAGEWQEIKQKVIMEWKNHSTVSLASDDLDDTGWTGTSISGYSSDVISTIDRKIKEQNSTKDVYPGKVIIRDYRAATAIEKELGLKYENIICKKVPFCEPHISAIGFRNAFLGKFPWAVSVANAVTQHLTLREVATREGMCSLPPLPHILLTGPSGAGKSAMLEEICRLLNAPHATASVGGSADDCGLSGTGQKWTTRSPSLPVQIMAAENCANPVIIIDEIDKSAGTDSRNGSVQGSLLSMMQPPAAGYMDACLNVPVDLSGVSFIATANSTTHMDGALLSRFKIIQVERPKPTTDNFWCLMDGIATKTTERLGLEAKVLLPEKAILDAYRAWVKSRCDIRALERSYSESLANLLTIMEDYRMSSGPEIILH